MSTLRGLSFVRARDGYESIVQVHVLLPEAKQPTSAEAGINGRGEGGLPSWVKGALKLTGSQAFKNGNVVLNYEQAK